MSGQCTHRGAAGDRRAGGVLGVPRADVTIHCASPAASIPLSLHEKPSENAPDHAALAVALERAGAATGASEAHGLLCGVLCAPGDPAEESWLSAVLGEVPETAEAVRECRSALLDTRTAAAGQLYSSDFAFRPLLPPDSEPVAGRSVALGKWCEGFLYGLALGGVSDPSNLPAEVREILADLGEFTHIEAEPEPSEEAEAAYAELVEYLRAAVQLVFEELRLEPAGGGARH